MQTQPRKALSLIPAGDFAVTKFIIDENMQKVSYCHASSPGLTETADGSVTPGHHPVDLMLVLNWCQVNVPAPVYPLLFIQNIPLQSEKESPNA